MAYSEKVLDHYNNPRNVGSLDKTDPNVGTGMVGAPECGDVMKLQLKVNESSRMIEVTPKAIEKIKKTFEREGVTGGLRLGVLGGGCSGLSYQFKFDTKERPTDKVFNYDGVKIYVDPKSLLYLN